jgi:hypothetical protein
VEVTNHEEGSIQLSFVGGILSTTNELPAGAPITAGVLRNITAVRYDLFIEPGEKKSVPYSFALDMQPQDVVLQLIAVVSNSKGQLFQIQAYNQTASIVEPPTSFFDPQM